jgi:KUP system potassium uptake protein
MTQPAMQVGLLPRFEMRRTSETQSGQIYMPRINWTLLVMVLLVVMMFRTSSALV